MLLGLLLVCCRPASSPVAGPSPQAPGRYQVRVSTGSREGVVVDWAVLPEEGWPLEGQRGRTPFVTLLPPGRVSAIFRAAPGSNDLEISVSLRLSDGSYQRIASIAGIPTGVVIVEPGARIQVLGPGAEAVYDKR